MTDTDDLAAMLDRALRTARQRVASPEAITAYEESLRRATEAEARSNRARRRKALDDAGVPLTDDTARAVAGGTLRPTRALEIASAWLAGPRSVLVLYGPPGTGKTTAAAHVACSRLGKGPFVYVREPTLARWGMFARYDREWSAAVSSATLIVDELGTAEERDLPAARAALLRIVDDRMGRGRRTVLAGNLSEHDVGRRYDARMIDRLMEVGYMAEVTGQSMRGER